MFCPLVVKVVLVIVGKVVGTLLCALAAGLVREPEVGAEATRLLQSLGEHLVLLDVVIGHGPKRGTNCLSDKRYISKCVVMCRQL